LKYFTTEKDFILIWVIAPQKSLRKILLACLKASLFFLQGTIFPCFCCNDTQNFFPALNIERKHLFLYTIFKEERMRKRILIVSMILPSLVFATWVSQEASVESVVDGDTIHVILPSNNKVTVRLLYIDTFETSRNTKMKSDVKKLRSMGYAVSENQLLNKGIEAKRYLISRFRPRTPVRLEYNSTKPYDRYGRILALVYTTETPPQCINEELILLGYARPYFVGKTPPQHKARIESAYQKAKQNNRWQWLEKTRAN